MDHILSGIPVAKALQEENARIAAGLRERGIVPALAILQVGSRTALQILSAMSVRDLSLALVSGDASALTRVPGIGKKTAQRLVLELKDKVEDSQLTGSAAAISPRSAEAGPEAEAVAALVALGYSASEAAKAVSRVAGQTDKVDELIFLALKGLG